MSTIKKSLEQIKASNTNAYQHLKDLIGNLVLNRQNIQQFEKCSFECRGQPRPDIVLNVRESYNLLKEYQIGNRGLLGKINTGTAEEPQEPASLTYQPNIMEECKIFAKFGVGFGEDETYRLFKSLAVLSVKKNTKQIRLWGKILGKEKDYYIAEGLADGGEQAGQLPPGVQAKGTGVNKYNYWVTNCLTGQWTQLPVITPQQLQVSRKLKYLFTGNLSAQILSNPLFPGNQAHLLKCQIVRMTTTCTIIPKGLFIVSPDDPKEIIPPEQPQPLPDVEEMSQGQNWVYSNPCILKNGRISHLKPEGLEGEDQQKWVKQQNQKDPLEPRLKSIAVDSSIWNIKELKGLKYQSVGHPKNSKNVSSSVVGIKSLLWPGWITISYESLKWSSIYVGYGYKVKQCYFPREPEQIFSECQDKDQVVIE